MRACCPVGTQWNGKECKINRLSPIVNYFKTDSCFPTLCVNNDYNCDGQADELCYAAQTEVCFDNKDNDKDGIADDGCCNNNRCDECGDGLLNFCDERECSSLGYCEFEDRFINKCSDEDYCVKEVCMQESCNDIDDDCDNLVDEDCYQSTFNFVDCSTCHDACEYNGEECIAINLARNQGNCDSEEQCCDMDNKCNEDTDLYCTNNNLYNICCYEWETQNTEIGQCELKTPDGDSDGNSFKDRIEIRYGANPLIYGDSPEIRMMIRQCGTFFNNDLREDEADSLFFLEPIIDATESWVDLAELYINSYSTETESEFLTPYYYSGLGIIYGLTRGIRDDGVFAFDIFKLTFPPLITGNAIIDAIEMINDPGKYAEEQGYKVEVTKETLKSFIFDFINTRNIISNSIFEHISDVFYDIKHYDEECDQIIGTKSFTGGYVTSYAVEQLFLLEVAVVKLVKVARVASISKNLALTTSQLSWVDDLTEAELKLFDNTYDELSKTLTNDELTELMKRDDVKNLFMEKNADEITDTVRVIEEEEEIIDSLRTLSNVEIKKIDSIFAGKLADDQISFLQTELAKFDEITSLEILENMKDVDANGLKIVIDYFKGTNLEYSNDLLRKLFTSEAIEGEAKISEQFGEQWVNAYSKGTHKMKWGTIENPEYVFRGESLTKKFIERYKITQETVKKYRKDPKLFAEFMGERGFIQKGTETRIEIVLLDSSNSAYVSTSKSPIASLDFASNDELGLLFIIETPKYFIDPRPTIFKERMVSTIIDEFEILLEAPVSPTETKIIGARIVKNGELTDEFVFFNKN